MTARVLFHYGFIMTASFQPMEQQEMREFRSIRGGHLEAEAAQNRARETRMRRALQRILTAAEGGPGFAPMNWADVAEVAREALEADRTTGTEQR